MSKALIAFLIVAGLFFLLLLLGVGWRFGAPAPVAETPSFRRLEVSETDPFKGLPQAPVTVIMAGSFTCSYCQQASQLMDQLLGLYPDKVRIVWKDLPEQQGAAYDAARAARCAQLQGQFWTYHDSLFRQPVMNEEVYKTLAKDLGLKPDDFNRCYENKYTMELIQENISQTSALNIVTVPYFQINDNYILEGLHSLNDFRQAVENSLNSGAAL